MDIFSPNDREKLPEMAYEVKVQLLSCWILAEVSHRTISPPP